jgi:hypothetical protein
VTKRVFKKLAMAPYRGYHWRHGTPKTVPHRPDKEWALIAPYVPAAKPGGRPEQYPKRDILDAIFYGDVRVAAGKRRPPSAGIIDSPSVKTTEKGGSTATTSPNTSTAAHGTSSSTPSGFSSR